jgi:hypothetical protein
MGEALDYRDLRMEHVDRVLDTEGELLVKLTPQHARACIAFIETTRRAQSWGPERVPRIARVPQILRGFLVTLRILVRHSKLFELGRVVVLNSTEQTWQTLPDGSYLFRFSKRHAA